MRGTWAGGMMRAAVLAVAAAFFLPQAAYAFELDAAALDLTSGDITFTFSRQVDDATIDPDKLFIKDGQFEMGSKDGAPSDAGQSLSGSTLRSTDTSDEKVTIRLTESLRQTAIGYDHVDTFLRYTDGAVQDLHGQEIKAPTDPNLDVTVTLDTGSPGLSSASPTLDEAAGTLTLTFDETVRAGSANVDLTKIFIGDNAFTAGGTALTGASVSSSGNSAIVIITLTETQRQTAIGYATPHLRFDAGAVQDTSRNYIAASTDSTEIADTADTAAPALSSATVNEGTGAWSATFSETVFAGTATGTVLYVRNTGGGAYDSATDVALTVPSSSAASSGTLSETDRQKVIAMATPTVYAALNAVQDASDNGNAAGSAAAAVMADTAAPALSWVLVGAGTVLTLTFDETVKSGDSDVTQSRIFVRDGAGIAGGTALAGAAVSSSGNSVSVEIEPTSAQRTAISGYTSLHVYLGPGAVEDTSGNANAASASSTPTAIPITLDSASIDLNNFAASGARHAGKLALVFNVAVAVHTSDADTLPKITVREADNSPSLTLGTDASIDIASSVATIRLSPAQKESVRAMSGNLEVLVGTNAFKSVNGSLALPAVGDGDLAIPGADVTADTTRPVITSAAIHEGTGVVTFNFDEYVKAGSADVNLGNVQIYVPGENNFALTGSTVTSSGNSATVTIRATEQIRQNIIALSNPQYWFSGGAAISDTSANYVAAGTIGETTDTQDAAAPTAESASYDGGSGALTATFSEAVDVSETDGAKFHLRESGASTGGFDLDGRLDAGQSDGASVTFTLTAQQRTAFAALSAPELDLDAGAVRDTSGNRILASPDNALAVAPYVVSASLDGRFGDLTLTFNRDVKASSSEDIDETLIGVRDGPSAAPGSANAFVLDQDSTFESSDTGAPEFELSEEQRQAVIAMADPRLFVAASAFSGTDGTPSSAGSGVDIDVTPDTDPPRIPRNEDVTLDEGTGEIAILFTESVVVLPAKATGVHVREGANNQSAEGQVTMSEDALAISSATSTVRFLLDEQSRQAVIAMTAPNLYFDSGAVQDTSGNQFSPRPNGYELHLTADAAAPTAESASYDGGSGALTATFSEAVDVSETDGAKFHLRESGASTGGFDLDGRLDAGQSDGASVTFTLTGQQRIDLAALSAPELDLDAGAVRDTSGNRILASPDNALAVVPYVVSATAESRSTVSVDFSAPVRLASGPAPAGWSVSGADAGAAAGAASITLSTSTAASSATLTLDGDLADKTLLDFTLAYSAGNIVDASGNALANYSGTPADGIAPVISSARATALNQITVTFSEPLTISDTAAQGWSISGTDAASRTVDSSTAAANGNSIVLTLSGDLADTNPDNAVLRYETSGTDVGTDAGSGSGAIRDGSSNALAARSSIPVSDGVAPAVSSAEATGLRTIEVTFSEPLTIADTTAQGWSISGTDASGRTVDSSTAATSANSIVLTLDSDLADTRPDGVVLRYKTSSGDVGTDAGSGSGTIADSASNALAARSSIPVSDGIAPTVSAEYVSRGSVLLAFSEPVRLASGTAPLGWSVSGADAGTAGSASAIAPLTASVAASSATLTLDGSLADKTLLDFTLAYSAGNIEDQSDNALAAYSAKPDDGIAPLIASAESRTLDSITVTFSEPVDATSTAAAATWVLGGADLPTGVAVSTNPAISTAGTTLGLSGNLRDPAGAVTLQYVPGDVEDKSDNAMISQQIDVTQNLAPVITSARATALDSITVTFSEPVTATATSPSSTWLLLGADASARVGAYAGASQSSTVVLGLSPPLPDTAPDVSLRYVRGPGDIADATSTPLESTASPHVTVSDGIPPALSSASLDEGTGALTLVFGEAIDVSAMTESGISVREAGASSGGVALSASARTTAADSATVSFTLSESDRQSVIAMSSPQLDVGAGSARDLAGNRIAAVQDRAIDASADSVAPVLQSASFDEGAGALTLVFNERMAAPTAGQAARISIGTAGAAVAFAEQDIAGARLDGAATTVTVTVSEAKRQEIIAADARTVDVLSGGLRDVSGAQASSSGTALSTVPDTARPSLNTAVLDTDGGLLVLSFSETMRGSSFAGELSKVSVQTPSGPAAISGTVRTDGARTIIALDAQALAPLLAAISAAPDAGAAGLLSLRVPGAAPQFADTSGNAVIASSIPRDVSIEDGSPPSLVSAEVTSSDTVVAVFSEDLDEDTVQQSDFGVPGYEISSVSETSGRVAITVSPGAFSARDEPRVELLGPVSDLFGNVLEPGSAVPSSNMISPVTVSRFAASHDGPAAEGDAVSITFRSPNLSGQPVLRVNGQPVTAATVPGGFDASYVVPAGARQGPLELYVLAVSDTGTPTEFSERDLTGPNAVIDTLPPSVVSAAISGRDSVTIVYGEPVGVSASDYTGIRADGAAPVPASRVYGSGGPVILVSWDGSGAVPSRVVLTSGAVEDAAGNAAAPSDITAGAPRAAVTLEAPALPLARGTVVQEIVAPPGVEPLVGVSSFTGTVTAQRVIDAGGASAVFESELRIVTRTPGLPDATFPAGTQAGGLGALSSGAVALAAGIAIEASSSTAHLNEDLREQFPLLFDGATVLAQVGDPGRDIVFDRPVLLEFDVPLWNALVFSVGTAGVPTPIPPCDPDWDASSLPVGQEVPEGWPPGAHDPDACVDAGSDSVWTGHFTVFGVSRHESGGGSECDDCTPPTLGYDAHGARLVDGGFAYNGLSSDVEHFFTPYPLIESEVGRENTAVLKIYENGGPANVSHVSLAFGLRSGEVISESRAVVNYDISFDGAGSVSVIDPDGAIDLETLAASHETVSCSEASELECLRISITHAFRAPLEFDIVGTDVWDRERNSWQNYYNHGVRVTGEPLDAQPGLEVDGMVLYRISPDSSNTDVMVDSGGRLFKLSPDGLYEPLSNQSRLYHDIDESMYVADGVPMQGYDRSDPRFRDALYAQVEEAQRILDSMMPGRGGGTAPQAGPVPGPDREAAEQRLREAVAAEQERARLLYEVLFGHRR